jgi:hypothetical protein
MRKYRIVVPAVKIFFGAAPPERKTRDPSGPGCRLGQNFFHSDPKSRPLRKIAD